MPGRRGNQAGQAGQGGQVGQAGQAGQASQASQADEARQARQTRPGMPGTSGQFVMNIRSGAQQKCHTCDLARRPSFQMLEVADTSVFEVLESLTRSNYLFCRAKITKRFCRALEVLVSSSEIDVEHFRRCFF